MKFKDVTLDFTSLLDVILIILFFFILYSVFDMDQAIAETEQTRESYEQMSADLEDEYRRKQDALDEEREQAREKIEAEWDRLLALGDESAANQRALDRFEGGGMPTFRLLIPDDDPSGNWSLRVLRGGEIADEILPGEPLDERIREALATVFAEDNEVMLVTFLYDGNALGSNRLCAAILDAFGRVGAAKSGFYLNTINISR
ncbi:MAG: hypothetical protein IKQ92_01155 [Clostridia bacterium]|nr:hypothetical protein [Clostridia bacterium]